jgi:hypothetical protein
MNKKDLFILLFVFNVCFVNAQDVIKKYDKYQNKFYVTLEDGIQVKNEIDDPYTNYFDVNLLKVYNSADTSYYLRINILHFYNVTCSKIDTRCLLFFNNDSYVVLTPEDTQYRYTKVRGDEYFFDFSIGRNELVTMAKAKSIDLNVFCGETEMKGKFDEEDFEELVEWMKIL